MAIRLEGRRRPYHPKDSDEVRCELHGVVTTWGQLSWIGKLCVEEGLDAVDECLLRPEPQNEGQNGRQDVLGKPGA